MCSIIEIQVTYLTLRARSSVRLERLPCKQEASGSNPDGSIGYSSIHKVLNNGQMVSVTAVIDSKVEYDGVMKKFISPLRQHIILMNHI